MTLMSAKVALPIHFFSPFSTQASPSRRQVVIIPPEVAEPTSGSVRPNEPIFSNRIIAGSQRCFCSRRRTGKSSQRRASVDAPEGRDRRIDAGKLHGDETVQEHAAASRAVSFVADSAYADPRDFRNDLEGELVARPIVLDDRSNLGFHEAPNPLSDGALLRVEQIGDPVEIAVYRRGEMLGFAR